MKIDLNADLGEGCASDSALLQLVSSANIACGFHAGDAVLMQQCVREALKTASLLAHTRASRTGKISVEPRCSYRQRRSTPGAVPNWRAGGNRTRRGELRHVKPHGMLYNRRRKSRLWPTLSPVRCAMPTPTWCWLGWRAASLSAPDSIIS